MGAVAKWQRCGLQNRYARVRFPPAPPLERAEEEETWGPSEIAAIADHPIAGRLTAIP